MSKKIDQLVAEKVMGWTWKERPKKCTQRLEWNMIVWPCLTETGYGNYYIPEYSSNIKDAWDVVSRMKKLGHKDFIDQLHAVNLWNWSPMQAAKFICLKAIIHLSWEDESRAVGDKK